MYYIPKLNEKLASTQMLLGSHVGFDSPFVTEMLGGLGGSKFLGDFFQVF